MEGGERLSGQHRLGLWFHKIYVSKEHGTFQNSLVNKYPNSPNSCSSFIGQTRTAFRGHEDSCGMRSTTEMLSL